MMIVIIIFVFSSLILFSAFKIQLENQHVVNHDQICVAAIQSGPNGVELSSAFDKRTLDLCKRELGLTILKVAQVVPDGLLVFFPSYSVMQDCVENWKKKSHAQSSLLDAIGQVKHIVFEPRDRKDMQSEMQRYYSLLDSSCSSSSSPSSPSSPMSSSLKKGAIFFSICRGKVSEGLDFADKKGRAVVIAGLPYPPLKDPKVILKRKYLDEQQMEGKGVLRGSEWYNQQSARAVNQAIGRVIRHQHDYGAIILADSRFADPRVHGLLSKWLRPFVNVYSSMVEVEDKLKSFFASKQPSPTSSITRSIQPISEGHPFASSLPEHHHHHCKLEERKQLEEIQIVDQHFASEGITNALHALSQPPLPAKERPSYSRDMAKIYLELVKTQTPNDTYKQFNDILKQYKAKQIDIEGLLKELSLLFNSKHDLLIGFRQFIPSKHLATFDSFLSNLQSSPLNDKLPSPESPHEILCTICKNDLKVPFKAPCAHIACFACWSGWLRGEKQECPECKCRLRMTLLKKHK